MLDAILEVRIAVVYATFAVLLVFFPFWRFRALPAACSVRSASPTSLAVLASLVVALTVTPALCDAAALRSGDAQQATANRLWCAGLDVDMKPCWTDRTIPPSRSCGRGRFHYGWRGMLPFFGGTFLPDLGKAI